jgi:hypothetical protein
LRKLPIASTCSSVLLLHQTYEDNEESRINFENDLDIGFFYADGFDERLYRNNYARIERNQFTINHTEIQNFNSNTRNNAEEIVVIDLILDTSDEEIIHENNNSHNERTPSIISSLSNDSRNELTPTTISSPSINDLRIEVTPSTISSQSINDLRNELTPSTISSPSTNEFDDEPNEQTSPLRNKRGNRSDSNESSQRSQSWDNSSSSERSANDNWNILLPEDMEDQLKRRNKRKK